MKTTLITYSAALLICGLTIASVQQAQSADISAPGNQYRSQSYNSRLGKLEKANKLVGMEVMDSQGEKLGKVKDFAVDLLNGRIVEVIVGTGGVMGVDERFVAIPPGQFTCNVDAKNLQLNVDKAQFKSAPSFKLSDWESNVREANITEVYHFYSVKPYFNGEGAISNEVAPTNHLDKTDLAFGNTSNGLTTRQDRYAIPNHLGEVQSATKIIGSTARNTQNEKLGKIENLMVDLPAGRVVEVILATGGFLAMGDELSAVPPQSFHMGIHPDTFTFDINKAALISAPHFKPNEWDSVNNSQNVQAVYRTYNVEPYFSYGAADPSAQNVRDRADAGVAPLDQGNASADRTIVRQIRKEIVNTPGLSANAKNVKIVTLNSRITLRGLVSSDEEARQVAAIATKLAPPGSVDNELQVENPSPTSSVK